MGTVRYYSAEELRDGAYDPILRRIAIEMRGDVVVVEAGTRGLTAADRGQGAVWWQHSAEYGFALYVALKGGGAAYWDCLEQLAPERFAQVWPRLEGYRMSRATKAVTVPKCLAAFEKGAPRWVCLCAGGDWGVPGGVRELRSLAGLGVNGSQRLCAEDLDVRYLRGLKVLALGNLPRLTALPSEIVQLHSLQQLYLSGNRLSALPTEIGQLRELQSLDLSDNQLTALPDSMRQMGQLGELFLHGNDALDIPPEILGPHPNEMRGVGSTPANPAEILDYYFRILKGASPLNEAKLILVGRGGVGKTTLIRRLTTGKFSSPKKTEGINIKEWPVPLSRKEKVQLNVWDFGGQEIMHSTHQFFLTERSLYLLVLSGREGHEDEDAEYWLKLIQSFGGDSPVIVVLNKQREHPFDVNRGGLMQKYPSIRAFVASDCRIGLGIGDLRKAIKRETGGLKGLRTKFPAQWFRIKDRLGGMEENYLTFERYREICGELGEKESESQDALAGYLHTLGVALNYCDDPRLSHMHVLNPRWVVEGIYPHHQRAGARQTRRRVARRRSEEDPAGKRLPTRDAWLSRRPDEEV